SPTSAACAAPASPTRPRNSRRTPPARKSTAGTRTDRRHRARSPSWQDSFPCLSLAARRLARSGVLSRASGHEIRMHHQAVAGERGGLDDLVVPINGDGLVGFVDQDFEEGQKIPGVKR